jgi:hypothetical protein
MEEHPRRKWPLLTPDHAREDAVLARVHRPADLPDRARLAPHERSDDPPRSPKVPTLNSHMGRCANDRSWHATKSSNSGCQLWSYTGLPRTTAQPGGISPTSSTWWMTTG